MAPAPCAGDDAAMQVLSRGAPGSAPATVSAVASLVVGIALFAAGIALAYLSLTTSIVDRLMSSYRPGPVEAALAIVGWTVAFVAPASFMLLGLTRVAAVADLALRRRRLRALSLGALAGTMGEDHLAARRVRLPDGRIIPELILGPFGVAVFSELPPPWASRHSDGRWEVRLTDGRWVPIENPLERTSRDAERVRRWLASHQNDFVVKVYAAVLAPDTSLPRIPTCAVITPAQVPAFLASLPVQRSLTADRRERIAALMRASV